jgi:hypothetical protein
VLHLQFSTACCFPLSVRFKHFILKYHQPGVLFSMGKRQTAHSYKITSCCNIWVYGQVKDSELNAKQDRKSMHKTTLWHIQIFACVFALIIHHAKCTSSSKLHPVEGSKY